MRLKSTKILILNKEHSIEFQKYAIENGCSWFGDNTIKHTNQPIICIDEYLMLSYSDDLDLFEYFDFREITFGEDSNININGHWIPNITFVPKNGEHYITPDLTHIKCKNYVANTESTLTKFHYHHSLCYPNNELGEYAAALHQKALLFPKERK